MNKVLKFIAALALVLPIVACEQENPDNGKTDKPDTETPGPEGEDPQDAPIEVIGLKAPEYGPVGGTFVVEGLGFPETSKLVLKTADGKELNLVTKVVENGLSAEVPADAAQAQYQLLATAETYKPLVIAEKFNLYIKKSVASVTFTQSSKMAAEGMVVEGATIMKWRVLSSADKVNAIENEGLISQKVTDASGEILQDDSMSIGKLTYKLNISDAVYTFTGTLEMMDEESGEMVTLPGDTFTLTVEDGRVVSNTVPRQTEEATYKWGYTAEGNIEKLYVSDSSTPYALFKYDKGNLIEYSASSGADFQYEESKGTFNPYHIDAAQAMMFFDGNLEDFQIAASLLGLAGKPSVAEPTMSSASQGLPIISAFDKDGYLVSLSFGDLETLQMEMKIEIEYK